MERVKIPPKKMAYIAIGTVWILFQLYLALVSPLHPMLQSPVHLMFALLIVYLNNPADKKTNKPWMKALDIPIYAGIGFVLYYVIANTARLTSRVQYVSPVTLIDKIAMVVCIIILLEAVRRTLGTILFGFILFFIVYFWFGKYFPSIFRFKGTNMQQFTELMTMGSSGIYGTPLYTSASSLFYFMLFGVFFSECGGGQLLIDLGMKASKNGAGGPAKAAVISSGLMGMISGSAVANVATTGVMTIPMMKKTGYEPHQAGAIEAVASTGGQIMPPIMGVGAFIMAEMLGVPYKTIAFAALIPAIAYFMSVFLLVTFMADKKSMTSGAQMTEAIQTEKILPRLYQIIPAIVLVYYMISGASLMRSGMMGIFTCLIINVVSKFVLGGKYCVSLKKLGETALQGVKQASEIAVPTAACGIIIGVVIQSGLATKVSKLIANVGSSYLILALLITMLGCMLLGMALPTVAAYLVANVLFVPTLIGLNIQPLQANMFVFYFGIMAQITPPVCVASFTAAGIAGADSMKTGLTGFAYALVAFLVPFIFIYDPSILLVGTPLEIVKGTLILFLGTYLLASGMAGFFLVPLNRIERGILLASAILIIIPETITDIIGIAVAVTFFVICSAKKRKFYSKEREESNVAA
ncbi:TRAP transporter fused permease subunit [Enterocloster aldenensis]|uniref:TRAP transporter permease n=1 Tax=Enterocloster aldenensis TaxID=358742 RepID=UPI000E49961E|nr:C4-dicarboxylate ABC transporter permease [Enterocloster aldenensis]